MDDPTDAGACYVDEKRIEISNNIGGAKFYRTVLHEIGHALGLDHTRVGIMAAGKEKPDDRQTGPWLRERRRWCAELARMVLKRRLREWRAEEKLV